MKMLIIGGTGDTGQWFVKFFKNQGFDVTVWGKNKRLDVAERLGVPFAENPVEAIQNSDVVMISVPINHTEATIAQVAPEMTTGSLLMDITSVKTGPVRAMEKHAPAGVEYLGTHPMFGPSIQDIRGQTVILTPTGHCTRWQPLIEKIYRESGAHIEILTPEEHDEIMRVVQGLTHYAYIAIGTTLQAINFDVAKSRRFMSPVYEIMLDFVGRILAQNPYLYAMIQANPGVADLHEVFIEECRKLSHLVKKGETEGFVERMKQAAAHFKNTESAQRRSDKLINNKIAEYEKLIEKMGSSCALRHLYTGRVHTGILAEVTPLTVTLKKNNRRTTLKIENIKLLTPEEHLQWRKGHEPEAEKYVSAYIPLGADPEILRSLLQKADTEVLKVEIIDTYQRNGAVSVAFRINMLRENHRRTLENLTGLLEGIGCTLR